MKISRRVVSGLDAIRALAAIYVMLGHVFVPLVPKMIGVTLRFGQEAVILFFLLSGFVIFANERDRAGNVLAYARRRAERIYPPLLAAIIVSTLLAIYNGDFAHEFDWAELVGTLAGLQDASGLKPGVIVDTYLDNNPLWSLSYEMAFYAIFPAILPIWKNGPKRTNIIIAASTIVAYLAYAAFPGHLLLIASYFGVWWAGAMCAELYMFSERSAVKLGQIITALLALCVAASMVFLIVGPGQSIGVYPGLPLRHFVAALVIVAVGFSPIGRRLLYSLSRWPAVSSFAASISYGVYVLHYPLLVKWQVSRTPAGMLFAFILLLFLAWACDRKTAEYFRGRRARLRSGALEQPS